MSFLFRIQGYLRRSGTTPTRFGREVVNDPRFVFDLRNGREPTAAMTARVLSWIETREGAVR